MLLTGPVFAEAFRRHEIRLTRRGGEPLVAVDRLQVARAAAGASVR